MGLCSTLCNVADFGRRGKHVRLLLNMAANNSSHCGSYMQLLPSRVGTVSSCLDSGQDCD